jgi:DNA-binding response OmpR family regulator
VSRRRLLIVEDEAAIRELLRLHLTRAGFEIEETTDGTVALERARTVTFDLIVLDSMLAGVDSNMICRAIRAKGVNTHAAILMLTAQSTEADMVRRLDSGADDVLAKPFGIAELLARVGAIVGDQRRKEHLVTQRDAPARRVESRDVMLDLERHETLVRGEVVELTKQEFDLLCVLAARPGIAFSPAALLKVWHGDSYVTERTVDTVIRCLRRKIERDARDPELILTAWGGGYKFVDPD